MKVAVVGSGCSGIAAIWALKSTDHEVHLFEASDRPGGHTCTATFERRGRTTLVDTGFMVMNPETYPNFLAFLREIGLATLPTDMTFGVSRDQGSFEWAGTSLSSIFAQGSNLFRGRIWRMLFDIVRFNQFALDLLAESKESEKDPIATHARKPLPKARQQESVGSYLEREGYSTAFRDDYLIPMTAAVWSTSPEKCSLDFPAITLVRFMWNHHLLTTFSTRPRWRTIKGWARQYVDEVLKDIPKSRLHLKCGITSLTVEEDGKIRLHGQSGELDMFDHVILATHGDQAMDIIRQVATDDETSILSAFQTTTNLAVLHSDTSQMPKRPITWSAWNYLTESSPSGTTVSSVCLTYWLNLLQHIPSEQFGPVFVTLNPLHPPSPALVQGSWSFSHPLYDAAAVRAQQLLPSIQNTRGISYAGAWTKYGFHEDGFSSGLRVAVDHLGARLPFTFVDSTFSRGRRPVLGWQDYCVRIFVYLIQIIVVIVGTALQWAAGEKKPSPKLQSKMPLSRG